MNDRTLPWLTAEGIASSRAAGHEWARPLALRAQPRASDAVGNRRGHGGDWLGVRPLEPGDDLRSIDWRASARSASPVVKLRLEEVQECWHLALDQRPNMQTGGPSRVKSAQAARLALALAEAATVLGLSLTASRWSAQGVEALPPETLRDADARMAWLVQRPQAWWEQSATGDGWPLSLAGRLQWLAQTVTPGATVFILTDGLDMARDQPDSGVLSHALHQLRALARPVLIEVQSMADWSFSPELQMLLRAQGAELIGDGASPETGRPALSVSRLLSAIGGQGSLDSSLAAARQAHDQAIASLCGLHGIPHVRLLAEESSLLTLLQALEPALSLLPS